MTPVRLLMSAAAREQAADAVAICAGRPHLYVAPGEDADVGFMSRDVIGLSTKHVVLPETKLIYLATPHSPLRAADRATIDRINTVIAAQCAADERCKFLDVNSAMRDPNGCVGSSGIPRHESSAPLAETRSGYSTAGPPQPRSSRHTHASTRSPDSDPNPDPETAAWLTTPHRHTATTFPAPHDPQT